MCVYVRAAVLRHEYFCIVYPHPPKKQRIEVACTIEYCKIIVEINVPSGGASMSFQCPQRGCFQCPQRGALNVPSGSALTLNP